MARQGIDVTGEAGLGQQSAEALLPDLGPNHAGQAAITKVLKTAFQEVLRGHPPHRRRIDPDLAQAPFLVDGAEPCHRGLRGDGRQPDSWTLRAILAESILAMMPGARSRGARAVLPQDVPAMPPASTARAAGRSG